MPPRAARMELVVKDQQFREGNQKQKEQLRFNFHAFGGGANFGIDSPGRRFRKFSRVPLREHIIGAAIPPTA
jgi:hypothetical protein